MVGGPDAPMGDGADLLPIDRSGARDLVGYRSSFPDNDTGACTLDIGPQHLNRLGLLHGGFISMLLDNGCGVAVRNAIGNADAGAVTATLSVSFIASVGAGRVTAVGRVTGGGRRLKFAEAELHDATGRLLATASATFIVLETGACGASGAAHAAKAVHGLACGPTPETRFGPLAAVAPIRNWKWISWGASTKWADGGQGYLSVDVFVSCHETPVRRVMAAALSASAMDHLRSET